MKPDPPPASDPLLTLLDEWQPRPQLAPEFELRLRRRIAAAEAEGWRARWRRWLQATSPQVRWSGAVATMALLVLVGVLLFRGGNLPPGDMLAQYQTAQVDPMVRDLQTLANDGDLLDHLDFLSVPMSAAPNLQERD